MPLISQGTPTLEPKGSCGLWFNFC